MTQTQVSLLEALKIIQASIRIGRVDLASNILGTLIKQMTPPETPEAQHQ